jgi:hypothetical protein
MLKLNTETHNFLIHNNLHNTIITPTRHDPVHNTSTILDITITTLTTTPVTAGTISPPITDHLPIITIFHTPNPRKQQNTQKTLSTNRYNKHKDTIIPYIQEAILTNMHPNTTVTAHFHNLQTIIQTSIEHFERKPKRTRAWITPKFKRQIKQQHKLHQTRLLHPTPENIKKHARCRNRLRKDIRNAKRATLKTSIEATQNDPKQQAKILKSVIPSNSNPRTSPTTLTYEDTTHTDPTKIANALNDHYITIGHKTAKTIPRRDNDDERENDDINEHTHHPPFALQHTNENKVTKVMNKINRDKASDIYKIKPAIIKDLTPFLTPILTTLFNASIDENEYPDSLKYTKVIEVYKSKDKTLPSNYRPISLLPIIAKLLDTLINDQLMHHLLKHNILSPTQYAFRPHSSTTLALQTIINNLHKNIRNKNPTLAIYVDLSKAYDTISHKLLIHKLQHEFNFTPSTTEYFASYLNNRQQSTHTQHAQSETQTITHGIPQGSTLSTTFFLLYINNIIKTVPNSTVYTYADDTTLLITTNTINDLQRLAQSELSSLIDYFHTNNLVPNPTKTTYTVFYPTTAHDEIQLRIYDNVLEHNISAKLLGIMMENKLKHTHTISNTIKKLQPILQTLRYATKLLPTKNMIQLYYSHVYPHLIQCITVWGDANSSKEYLKPLTKMQKKIIRITMNRPPRTPTKPLMSKHNILNITNLYIQRVCLEAHPFIHKTKEVNRPEHNHTYLNITQIHNHHTRHSTQGNRYEANPFQYSKNSSPVHEAAHLTQRYTHVWNSLPTAAKQKKSLTGFKALLKKHLLKKQSRE